MTNKVFCKKINEYIDKYKSKKLDIIIHIGKNKDIHIGEINFPLDLGKVLNNINIQSYKIKLFFEDIIFCEQVTFRDVKLETLSFKNVTFLKNVRIKENRINKLILRPYQIDAHIVVNNGGYASIDGYIKKPDNTYINNIEFEDPHICNAKIYFIGIAKKAKCDFKNRNLENVIFQNCNFKKTKFLNSFLKETKFFNCEFPIIDNETDTSILSSKNTIIIISVMIIIMTILLFRDVPESYIILMATLSPFFILVIESAGQQVEMFIGNIVKKILKTDNKIGKHNGIYDEAKLENKFKKYSSREKNGLEEYTSSSKNISDIYMDLKINFRNNGDLQKSGDFHYASNVLLLSTNTYIDKLVLMLSYIFNGFGERPFKGFFMIAILLSFVVIFQQPNKDYISTLSTPVFLLQIEKNESVIAHSATKNSYEYNANFYFDRKNRYSSYLEEDEISTRIYYALSHITTPFTVKNKEWFQHKGKTSHMLSAIFSIFIWLYFIGMMKAIFNRIKR